jgi:hypothetical protein
MAMNTPLDDLLSSLMGNLGSGLHIAEGKVTVKLGGPAANFVLIFEPPAPKTATEIREREGTAYAIPVRMRLVNRNSGKDVRGFGPSHVNAWWLRQFVYNLAAAVAYIEREWDVLSPEFIAKMEKDN